MATAEQITIISNLSRYGFTQQYISGVLGVPSSTLSDWKRKDPKVANALSISTDGLLSDVKSKMFKTAMTGSDKDSNQASQFLLNRYEVDSGAATVAGSKSDKDIADEILSELDNHA